MAKKCLENAGNTSKMLENGGLEASESSLKPPKYPQFPAISRWCSG
jgi:hypothetical protein